MARPRTAADIVFSRSQGHPHKDYFFHVSLNDQGSEACLSERQSIFKSADSVFAFNIKRISQGWISCSSMSLVKEAYCRAINALRTAGQSLTALWCHHVGCRCSHRVQVGVGRSPTQSIVWALLMTNIDSLPSTLDRGTTDGCPGNLVEHGSSHERDFSTC